MCHSRHHRSPAVGRPAEEAIERAGRPADEASARAGRPAEEAIARDPALRASDEERESVAAALREHGAAGRLDIDELEQRVGAAYAARTHAELSALLTDLPRPPRAPRARSRDRLGHEWGAFLRVNLLLVAIWAVTGAGYFWPAWVLVWWGLALLARSGPRMLRAGGPPR